MLNTDISIPTTIIPAISTTSHRGSCSIFSSGNWLSANDITIHRPITDITPLSSPLTIARRSKGREINHRVAPTICMVFIRKRLLNIASRTVLSIRMITTINSKAETTPSIKPILRKLLWNNNAQKSTIWVNLV